MAPTEKDTVQGFIENKDDTSDVEAKQAVPIEDEAWRKTEKSLVRKLDMTLLPMVWLLYMFNYLDRNNIA